MAGVSSGTTAVKPVPSVQSIASWLGEINPLFSNPFVPQAKVNCGSCAFAVYSRLNGDTKACASLTNIPYDYLMENATGKKCVYMHPLDIENQLKQMGAGGHLIAGITRRLPDGRPITGHWFNLYYDGKDIYTIDGQSGEVYEWPHDYGYIDTWCAMV